MAGHTEPGSAAEGTFAYPHRFGRTHEVPQLLRDHSRVAALICEEKPVCIAGRLAAVRVQGGSGFAQVQDQGARLQVYLREDQVDAQTLDAFRSSELGDYIGVEGSLFITRARVLTLRVKQWQRLAPTLESIPGGKVAKLDADAAAESVPGAKIVKGALAGALLGAFIGALTSPPTDEHSASDVATGDKSLETTADVTADNTEGETGESAGKRALKRAAVGAAGGAFAAAIFSSLRDKPVRYRQRHLDLLVDPRVRQAFEQRAAIIAEVRAYLVEHGFLEVETPVLQPLYGGAAARPFTTHLHEFKQRLYLRIATELYLKRLVIGGFDRVFEIGKDFRNEGLDRTHNPEFTALEFYEAYADYNDMRRRFQELWVRCAKKIHGGTSFVYQGRRSMSAASGAV